MSDLNLSAEDEVLLESLVLAASDNVTYAQGDDRGSYSPTRRRVFVETDGDNVYLGTGDSWVDVSDTTGLVSSLFQGGDLDVTNVTSDSVNTDNESIKERTTYTIADGETRRTTVEDSTTGLSKKGSRFTSSVGTSATAIWNLSDGGQTHEAAVLFIEGRDESSSGNRFTDIVHVFRFSGVSVISSMTRSDATARTYSEDAGETEDVLLSMESGSYRVQVSVIEVHSA